MASTTFVSAKPAYGATRSIGPNRLGRDVVLGDVSCDFALLDRTLRAQHFDPTIDRLICVGQVGGDGRNAADARAVLRFLSQPHVHALRGASEQRLLAMMDDAADAPHVPARPKPTRALLAANHTEWFASASASEQARALQLIAAMPLAIESVSETGAAIGFVHAQVQRGLSWQSFMRQLEADDSHAVDLAVYGSLENGDGHVPAIRGVETIYTGPASTNPVFAAHAAFARPLNVQPIHRLRILGQRPSMTSTVAAKVDSLQIASPAVAVLVARPSMQQNLLSGIRLIVERLKTLALDAIPTPRDSVRPAMH